MEIAIVMILLVGSLLIGERVVNWLRFRLKPAHERALLERAQRSKPASDGGARQRGALKGCANCGAASLTLPHRDASGATYCSEECLIWSALGPTEFCEQCVRHTADESTGDMNRFNGIGRSFGGTRLRCTRCRSVVRRFWFTFFFVPLIPLGQYRVLQASPTEFYTRKLG